MVRVAICRLRLEPCEERALPSAVFPADNSTARTAHNSTTNPSEHVSEAPADTGDDDSEYATKGKGTATPPRSAHEPSGPGAEYPSGARDAYRSSAEDARAEAAEYGPLSLPPAPPMPAGPVTQGTPAVAPAATATGPVSVASVVVPTGSAPPVSTPPAPPPGETSVVTPDGGDPTDPSVLPPSGPEEPPPGSEAEPPPAGSPSPVLPFIGELELHVSLAGWTNAAGELLGDLDAVFSPLDGESPWARLGYWAVAVGAVGVTVELTRQGLRKKSPEPGAVPNLPGAQ